MIDPFKLRICKRTIQTGTILSHLEPLKELSQLKLPHNQPNYFVLKDLIMWIQVLFHILIGDKDYLPFTETQHIQFSQLLGVELYSLLFGLIIEKLVSNQKLSQMDFTYAMVFQSISVSSWMKVYYLFLLIRKKSRYYILKGSVQVYLMKKYSKKRKKIRICLQIKNIFRE